MRESRCYAAAMPTLPTIVSGVAATVLATTVALTRYRLSDGQTLAGALLASALYGAAVALYRRPASVALPPPLAMSAPTLRVTPRLVTKRFTGLGPMRTSAQWDATVAQLEVTVTGEAVTVAPSITYTSCDNRVFTVTVRSGSGFHILALGRVRDDRTRAAEGAVPCQSPCRPRLPGDLVTRAA